MGEVDHPTTSFIDSGLEPETEYTYTMTAVDDEGNEGDFSDPDSTTTDVEPVDDSFDGTMWASSTDEALSFIQDLLISSMDHLDAYWTGWWPVCHIVISWNPFVNVELSLHLTLDLLLNIDIGLDGCVSLIVPFLTYIGIDESEMFSETRAAIYRLRGFHDVMNPWEISDWAAIAAMVAGMAAGTPIGSVAYGIALVAWWVSLAGAIINDYIGMINGDLERFDVGLQCVQKGFQYAIQGGAGLAAGIGMNMAYNEKVLNKEAGKLIDDNPAREIIDNEVPKNVISGILNLLTGFVVVIVGVLIWNGL